MPQLRKILDDLFENEIRKRGYDYFRDDLVKKIRMHENSVTAVVHGTYKYDVEIEFDDDLKPVEMFCSCPFFDETNCKHLAALLYSLNSFGFFISPFYKEQLKGYLRDLSYIDDFQIESLTDDDADSPETQEAKTRKQKKEIWLKENQRRKEEAKFNEFKSKVSELVPQVKAKKSKTKFRIAYAIEPKSYSTTIHLIKQKLLKDGTVASADIARSVNFDNVEPLSLEERLVINLLGKSYYAPSFYLGNSYNTQNDIALRQLLGDILNFLIDKEVYLYKSYSIKEKVFILKKEEQCKLFIDEDEKNIKLQLEFYLGEEKIPSGTEIIPVLDNPLWIMAKDKIFRISNLKYEQLSVFLDKQGKILIPKVYLNYFEENVLPKIASELPIVSEKYSVETVSFQPQKKLFLEENDTNLSIHLKFGYGELVLPYNETENATTFIKNNKITRVVRNKELEASARTEITNTYVKELEPGVFIPRNNPIDFLFNHLPTLNKMGFEILGDADLSKFKINTSTPKFMFTVSSGVDWFDLETKADFNGVTVSLSELIESIKHKKRYIKLSDGSAGILPEEWIKKFNRTLSLGEVNEGKIRFSKIQANALDALLNESDKVEKDNQFKEYVEKLNSFEKIKEQTIPKTFKGKLREYQKGGLHWFYFLKEFSFGGILADDMGLGKTIQVLALFAKERLNGQKAPSLVVAPTSVVFNWINEAERFVPSLKILNHTGSDRIKDNGFHFDDYDVILTSYAILLRDFELFLKQNFHYVILDESQKIKNPISKTAKLVRRLNASNRLCLTGTPVENNLNELWSQMAFLNPGMLGSLNKFQDAFTKPIQKDNDRSATNFLKRTIYPFVLRRTKELVAKELPPKTEMIHYCEMDSEQEKIYSLWKDSIRKEILKEIEDKGIKKSGFKVLEGLLRLRQICNHPVLVDNRYKKKSGKFEEFKEMITEVIDEGHKVLVFSQFVQMLEIIRTFLDSEKISYEYLTGSTKDRESCVNNFQNNKDIKLFLISLKAGGFGLNLTAADYVFHYDPWWNPAVETQATDRTHRIGQNKNVFVYKFITKETVEEKILLLQEKKRELVQNIITTETGILKNLTREDIELLFG